MPAKSHFATMLVHYVHERYFHANQSLLCCTLFNTICLCWWIKSRCEINNLEIVPSPFLSTEVTTDGQSSRRSSKSPFSIEVVGIDVTGAFSVKCNFHQVVKYTKAYATIFTCMVTHAVHIEVIPTLSTEDFLNALKCFVSRYEMPETIYSDNGTNFQDDTLILTFRMIIL